MADDQQEKTEQATAKRREDFRKKGQVAQSREVHTAALMTAMVLLWFFYAPLFWKNLQSLVGGLMARAGAFEVTPLSVVDLMIYIMGRVGLLLAPVLLLVLVVGFLSSIAQIGFLFTTKPLEPDFSKLDPIKGAARFVSKRSLVELVKSLAKVLLLGFIAYKTVAAEFADGLLLVDMPPAETVGYLGRVAFMVLLKSSGVLILLALLDFMFVRWELEQKMKMTKQEQKEEFKETEGDPHVKGRIRSIQAQMARKRMMAEVPKADVVITNPTHFSVAIRYKRGEMDAPVVVAKGADDVAMKIREIAREHKVPLVENKPVARALMKVELDHPIPEEMFKAVAEILAYVYSLKKQ
ncbi:flagellar biosynthetic protein FlhB [Desulfuromonas versatilis]|uniref:Flagellar biosynthetic protein FlhB n=1 Tax=Desulfuromonas versatilis TaxID=2802975 RepID=A0ABN6E5K8_9BACT|nr:flagellar biosynthesis protein FlhB [Desulfuromonas versatilis]BCR06619.1 flagellar biosynthetic protein FlhB [Desulfuromonas versatilis]